MLQDAGMSKSELLGGNINGSVIGLQDHVSQSGSIGLLSRKHFDANEAIRMVWKS